MNLEESLKTTASFLFEVNKSLAEGQRMGIFTGHYNVDQIKVIGNIGEANSNVVLTHNNIAPLQQAGYSCDVIADDSLMRLSPESRGEYPLQITAKKGRTRISDFQNYIKYSGMKVSKIRITDLSGDETHPLFNGEIEVSRSQIGSKGPSDYIQLSTYIDPRNYKDNIIEIDLTERELLLDETTVVIMDLCPGAKFQMDFILD